jgi:hypothetical protein
MLSVFFFLANLTWALTTSAIGLDVKSMLNFLIVIWDYQSIYYGLLGVL